MGAWSLVKKFVTFVPFVAFSAFAEFINTRILRTSQSPCMCPLCREEFPRECCPHANLHLNWTGARASNFNQADTLLVHACARAVPP